MREKARESEKASTIGGNTYDGETFTKDKAGKFTEISKPHIYNYQIWMLLSAAAEFN